MDQVKTCIVNSLDIFCWGLLLGAIVGASITHLNKIFLQYIAKNDLCLREMEASIAARWAEQGTTNKNGMDSYQGGH